MRQINYATVPVSYMANGMRNYFENGILPGSFATALLENNLTNAAAQADDTNRRFL